MSARDSVLAALRRYYERPEDALETLEAYRAEVLCEAAASIRAHAGFGLHETDGADAAAGLIDSDAEADDGA